MNAIQKSSQAVLILFILFAMSSFSSPVARAETCIQHHTVQSGETLYLIGLKYGYTWTTLAKINNLANPNRILAGQVLCVGLEQGGSSSPTPNPTPTKTPSAGKIPTFTISQVISGQTVTIQTANFPANDTFEVFMGAIGTKGIGGNKVGTVQSGNGGGFSATFNIPQGLKGSALIAIRLQSPTSGYFSYNWFTNKSSGGSGNPSPTPTPSTGKIPTFTITAVSKDQTVTIQTANFPANKEFEVRMGAMGTKAIGGFEVDTINSKDGGSFTATFKVPAELQGASRISIRLDSTSSGHYSYNWFSNSTTQ
jgi:hypothetical protein